MSSQNRNSTQFPRDPDIVGAEAAMHRAARLARERAETAKIADTANHAMEASRAVGRGESWHDPRTLTFSQAQGYDEVPEPLKLEELPSQARVQIWNEFYFSLRESLNRRGRLGRHWGVTLASKHVNHDKRPADEWKSDLSTIYKDLRHCIETLPFNRVFDLIQFVLREPSCPPGFAARMKRAFSACGLAYTIDDGNPPTIIPAATPEEGRAVVEALQALRRARFDGGASHFRRASEQINAGDWAGSVRESIHAVESVARQLDPDASKDLRLALASIEKRGALHPALKDAFKKLYGYASDEQGVRHPLLDRPDPNVGMDEALFMLSACASFTSYLSRKHMREAAPGNA